MKISLYSFGGYTREATLESRRVGPRILYTDDEGNDALYVFWYADDEGLYYVLSDCDFFSSLTGRWS